MPLSFRHLTSSAQIERADMDVLLENAEEMERVLEAGGDDRMRGKILASLFFEPSTRTRLSFEAAMYRLGGNVVTADGLQFSSLYKGESIGDTMKVLSYVDVIAMRHPRDGSADEAARASKPPFINAGDGQNQHPSQALLDAYTIKKEKGSMDGLKIAMVGDLKYGRTVHSLCKIMGEHYRNAFTFVSPDELRMPDKVKMDLDANDVSFRESVRLEDALDADIIYMTRIQKERFPDTPERDAMVARLQNLFVLQPEMIRGTDITVMHPLPRNSEIPEAVDALPNAAYFRQAENGLPMRMALLDLMVERKKKKSWLPRPVRDWMIRVAA